ncbi:hypothetical protein CA601_13450 [Paraburkholderia hospita]|nr:hypothetical protein CA601_13450 [Paraburkholderia hospita]
MGTFRVIVGMWIAPDLAAVRRVSDDSPVLNHDHFDAAAIAQALDEFNQCGERIRIRFADDTVDLATTRARINGSYRDLRTAATSLKRSWPQPAGPEAPLSRCGNNGRRFAPGKLKPSQDRRVF